MVLPDLSRPCHGGDSPLPVVPCTLVVDGADPSAQRKDHIMTAQLDAPALDVAKLEEFAGKVAADQAAAYNAILVYLGDRVGLWRALASVRSATVADLAESSGVARRYVQEWLSAQAANGYVTYDSTNDSFALSVEAAAVLAEEESPTAMMSGFELIAAVWGGVDRLAHVYTTGEGLAWHDQDPRLFGAVARFYGTAYRNSLLTEWLPAVDGLIERLTAGIRVLDVGCGLGVPTIMLAEAFPNSTFVGTDYHEESIRLARAAAEEAGVGDRVHFEVADATSYAGSYDLVLFFDAVHDFGDPVGALAHARERAGFRWPGRRGRAVRRGHPRGEPGQPDRRGVLRRQLGSLRPAQRVRRRCRTRRSGRADPPHRRVPGCRLRVGRGRCSHADQLGDRGEELRQSTHVGEARGSIRRLADGDIETVIAFSVAAWAPVFASLETELGTPTREVESKHILDNAHRKGSPYDAWVPVPIFVDGEGVVGGVVEAAPRSRRPRHARPPSSGRLDVVHRDRSITTPPSQVP